MIYLYLDHNGLFIKFNRVNLAMDIPIITEMEGKLSWDSRYT